VAFNHATIGVAASPLVVNRNWPLENVSLTSVGVTLRRGDLAFNNIAVRCGLTPPGDENVQVYHTLVSGRLSPGDGLNWSGSIRVRDSIFLVINYIADAPCFIYLTWTSTA